jgi:hypothetical protein
MCAATAATTPGLQRIDAGADPGSPRSAGPLPSDSDGTSSDATHLPSNGTYDRPLESTTTFAPALGLRRGDDDDAAATVGDGEGGGDEEEEEEERVWVSW